MAQRSTSKREHRHPIKDAKALPGLFTVFVLNLDGGFGGYRETLLGGRCGDDRIALFTVNEADGEIYYRRTTKWIGCVSDDPMRRDLCRFLSAGDSSTFVLWNGPSSTLSVRWNEPSPASSRDIWEALLRATISTGDGPRPLAEWLLAKADDELVALFEEHGTLDSPALRDAFEAESQAAAAERRAARAEMTLRREWQDPDCSGPLSPGEVPPDLMVAQLSPEAWAGLQHWLLAELGWRECELSLERDWNERSGPYTNWRRPTNRALLWTDAAGQGLAYSVEGSSVPVQTLISSAIAAHQVWVSGGRLPLQRGPTGLVKRLTRPQEAEIRAAGAREDEAARERRVAEADMRLRREWQDPDFSGPLNPGAMPPDLTVEQLSPEAWAGLQHWLLAELGWRECTLGMVGTLVGRLEGRWERPTNRALRWTDATGQELVYSVQPVADGQPGVEGSSVPVQTLISSASAAYQVWVVGGRLPLQPGPSGLRILPRTQ